MSIMFLDLVDVCVLVYLDKILMYFSIAEDHTRYIRAEFTRLVK